MLLLLNNSPYFDVVMRGLSEALTELQVEHRIVDSYEPNDRDNVYVICTTHERRPVPLRYVSYNFEQLTTERSWDCLFFEKLRRAEEVWDYSRANIEVLATRHNIRDVKHVPFGYARCMEHAPIAKTVDILFLGRQDGRRSGIMADLRNRYVGRGERIVVGCGVWGDFLRQVQGSTRVGLNVHVYERGTILEVHRIIPLVANRAWVVTERSCDAWYDRLMAPVVQYVETPQELLTEADNVLRLSETERVAETQRRYTYLTTHCRYVDFVKGCGSKWLGCPAGEKSGA